MLVALSPLVPALAVVAIVLLSPGSTPPPTSPRPVSAFRTSAAREAETLAASPVPIKRLRGVRALRASRSPETSRLLLAALADPDPRVRVAAAEEIADLGDRSLLPALLARPLDAVTATALAGLVGREEDWLIAEMGCSPDPVVRMAGARATVDRPHLLAAVGDPDERVRVVAQRRIREVCPADEAAR